MKKILLIVLLLLIGFAVYWFKFRPKHESTPKEQPILVGKHSVAFGKSVDSIITAYTALHDALVNDDSVKAKAATQNLIVLADSNKLSELKKDSAAIFETAKSSIEYIVATGESLVKQPNLAEMRKDFKDISENMYALLKTIHYEGKTLYWQNCPMAFGENNGANWISNTEEIMNPYLGKNHPEFKGSMLHCGEILDSIKAQ